MNDDLNSLEYWKNSYFELQEINKNLQWEDAEKLNKINQLYKENEELKKDKEYLDKVNDEQMERILDLSDELKNEIAFNEESETVKKYKAQIEKMKCCENCKHYIDSSCEFELPIRCKYWYTQLDNTTDEWKLAE